MRLALPVALALAMMSPCLPSLASLARAEGAPPAAGAAKARKGRTAEKADRSGSVSPERFRHEIEGRIAKARDKMEQSLGRKKLPAGQAQARRQHFEGAVAQLRARVSAVSSDGVVTRGEAREVRAMLSSLRSRPVAAREPRHKAA